VKIVSTMKGETMKENNTLFETGQYFTLSGDQGAKFKEFKKPEQRAPLTYWVQTGDGPKTVIESVRVTVDQLYEGKAILKGGGEENEREIDHKTIFNNNGDVIRCQTPP
jgi:peptidoglycan hydrolase-like amidase